MSTIRTVGSDLWVAANALYDGTNWNRVDIGSSASALRLGSDGIEYHYFVAAGANPITWTLAATHTP